MTLELEFEGRMAQLGVDRYRAKVAQARAARRQSEMPAGRYLIREAVGKMTTAIEEWLKEAEQGAGKEHYSAARLKRIGAASAAIIAVRSVVDGFGHETGIAAAAHAIGTRLEEEDRYLSIRGHEQKVWSDLKKRMKRSSRRSERKRMAVSVEGRMGKPFSAWDKKEQMRAGLLLLELIHIHTGLIEMIRVSSTGRRKRTLVVASEGALKWFEESTAAHEALSPFWMPCLEVPRDWINLHDGGYHSSLVPQRSLVKSRDKDTLLMLEEADMPEVYAAVNTLQHTAWEINPDVFQVALYLWQEGIPIAGIPTRDDPPMPPKVDSSASKDEQYEQRKERAIWFARRATERSRRILLAKTMFIAELLEGEEFYFPYQADFRGRLYPVPFFLQPQGPSLARGLLRFRKGKPIDSVEAESWLAMHGANTWGHGVDKLPMSERVQWVLEHKAEIQAVYTDPLDAQWWADADKPWEFLAFCLEWGAYLETGPGFVSRIPVAMDGSNNGLQIFSLLMRDPVGAACTNCAPGEQPQDVYQDVADEVTNRLKAAAAEGEQRAIEWLTFLGAEGLPRAATKRQVMTLPYGSTLHACIHYTRDWYEQTLKDRGQKRPMERGYKPSVYLAKIIWDAIGAKVGAARECMNWLRACSDLITAEGKPVKWTSPTGFPVKQSYVNYTIREIKTAIGESVRWTRYRDDGSRVLPGKQANGISPNYVHSLDAAVLVKSINLAKALGVHEFAMVHDSYGVPAADAATMAGVLRQVYADTFSGNLLADLRDQLVAQHPDIAFPAPPAQGTFDVQQVKDSLYFFA